MIFEYINLDCQFILFIVIQYIDLCFTILYFEDYMVRSILISIISMSMLVFVLYINYNFWLFKFDYNDCWLKYYVL